MHEGIVGVKVEHEKEISVREALEGEKEGGGVEGELEWKEEGGEGLVEEGLGGEEDQVGVAQLGPGLGLSWAQAWLSPKSSSISLARSPKNNSGQARKGIWPGPVLALLHPL